METAPLDATAGPYLKGGGGGGGKGPGKGGNGGPGGLGRRWGLILFGLAQ